MPKQPNEPMTVSQWNKFLRKRKKNKKPRSKDKRLYVLYALELEDGCYYVGISRNVERRFQSHLSGKGAIWTTLHKPIKIIEQRPTGTHRMNVAALMEDKMTLEYARTYGYKSVRGGGYCQAYPRWPNN